MTIMLELFFVSLAPLPDLGLNPGDSQIRWLVAQSPESVSSEPNACERDTCPREPQPRNYRRWATRVAQGYPKLSEILGEEGVVGFKLAVNSSGFVDECIITQSSGHLRLDESACYSLKRYARFYPALDRNGVAVPGEFENRITYRMDMGWLIEKPLAVPRKLESWSKRVERNYSKDIDALNWSGQVSYLLGVAHNGRATRCFITRSSGHEQIDLETCALLEKHARFEKHDASHKLDYPRANWVGSVNLRGR